MEERLGRLGSIAEYIGPLKARLLNIGHWTFKLVISNHNKACNSRKLRCLTYFYFFIIMVTRMCAHHVEKIRKVYRRFISLEDAFGKMVLKLATFLT